MGCGSKAVFFAADAAYFELAWVAARRAAAEPGRDFDVWMLVDKAPTGTAPPPGVFIKEIELPEVFIAVSGPAHMSAFSYARLLAADYWLRDYDRLLYIDSDTRIAGALTPLLELDLGHAMAAMAEDCGRYLGAAGGRENWDEYRARLMEQYGRVQEGTGKPKIFISKNLVDIDDNEKSSTTGMPINFLNFELENLRWEENKADDVSGQKSIWGKQPNHAIDALTYILTMIEKPVEFQVAPTQTGGVAPFFSDLGI